MRSQPPRPTLYKFFSALLTVALLLNISTAARGATHSDVSAALNSLDSWLNSSPQGPKWKQFLQSAALRDELARGEKANPEVVQAVLSVYQSGAPGLEMSRFARVREALTRWQIELASQSPEALAAAALAAKDHFVPQTDEDIQQARARAVKAIGRLGRFLGSGPNGRGWKRYLRWEKMLEQLGSDDPDLAELEKAVQRYAEDHKGLRMKQFRSAKRALREYIDARVVATNPKVKPRYQKLAEELADRIRTYSTTSTHRDALEIAGRLSFMDRYRQAPAIVKSVRRRYSKPNMVGYLSSHIVAAGLERAISEPTPIRENILGTSVVGQGHTDANVTASLASYDNGAAIDLNMSAVTQARSTGRQRGAAVRTASTTNSRASKRIVFTVDGGWTSMPATASASMSTRYLSLSMNRGGRLIHRIAWKKAYQQKPAAEREGARRAEQRVQQRFDRQTADQLVDANTQYREKFRKPLEERDAFPQLFYLRTTPAALHVTVAEATNEQLAAPAPPPALPKGSDMALTLHESMVNNVAAMYLGDRTIRSKDLEEDNDANKFFKDMREQREAKLRARGIEPRKQEDRPPWAVTFAKRNPLSVEFRDSNVKFTIRAVRFEGLDDQVYSRGMSIWAVYGVEQDDSGGLKLTLKEWDVDPTSIETGGKFVPADAPLRSKLRARMKDLLEGDEGQYKVVQLFPLEMPGKWSKLGEMAYSVAEAKDGWMTLAFDQIKDKVARRSTPRPVVARQINPPIR